MNGRRFHFLLVTFTALLALTGCAKQVPPVVEAPLPPPVVEPTPLPPVTKPPPPKPAAPVPPAADIELIGMSQPQVAETLGEPAERQDNNPGQTWIYRAGKCTVEVLFLLDVTRNDQFVVDRSITGTEGTPRADQLCLQRIARNRDK
jgi:hypothetical protein